MNRIAKTIAITAAAAMLTATIAAPASAGWRGHRHGGAAAAAGVLGVLALGAIAASSAAAANAEPVNCVIEKRPAYNSFGDFVGYKRVRVCD